MARTKAELPKGARITDYISLGVIGKVFPMEKVKEDPWPNREDRQAAAGPARSCSGFYVIALALYTQVIYPEVLRCLLEGLQGLAAPGAALRVTGKSGISQAHTRLGTGVGESGCKSAESALSGVTYRSPAMRKNGGDVFEISKEKQRVFSESGFAEDSLAERVGFEPTGHFRHPHAFQACTFGLSVTSPRCGNPFGLGQGNRGRYCPCQQKRREGLTVLQYIPEFHYIPEPPSDFKGEGLGRRCN